MKKENDINKFDKFNFESWCKKNEVFLTEHYNSQEKHSKEILKEDYEYFKIDYKFFCLLWWKAHMSAKGDNFIPYTQQAGKIDMADNLYKFINEYAINITDISKIDIWEVLKYANTKQFFKTFYYINAALLGVENYYFEMMYDKIIDSEFHKDLSEGQKKELEKLMTKLKKFEPESKSNEDLIKSYFKIAFQINDVPVLDELHSDVYSRSSWRRKLKDLNFVVMLIKQCDKRLNKSLIEKKKELIIKIKQNLIEQSKNIQISEKENIGITKKSKRDFDETFYEKGTDSDF